MSIPEDIFAAARNCASVALRNLDQDDCTVEVTAIAKAIHTERERCAKICSDEGAYILADMIRAGYGL